MNDTVFEGTTLEDALSKAAEALDVAPDALEYEVTEESDGGFWGLDESFVRLRARPRPEDEEATKEEQATEEEEAPEEEQATEDDADVSPEGEEDKQRAPEPTPPLAEKPARATPVDPPTAADPDPSKPEAEGFWATPVAEIVESQSADEPARTIEEAPETDEGPINTGTPVNKEIRVEEGEAAADGGDLPAAKAEAANDEVDAGGDAAADASPEIESLVKKIFAGMEFDCTIGIQAEAEIYMAMVGGADKELLLEGNGRPLSALELILNHAFRHRLTERRKIRVDAGDFRSRREDELRDLAFQVAHSAKETERTQETQPLNPYERRLVHLALAEDSTVTTRSRGSGFLKNVQVIPRQSGHGNR